MKENNQTFATLYDPFVNAIGTATGSGYSVSSTTTISGPLSGNVTYTKSRLDEDALRQWAEIAEILKQRMLIITENFEKHDKYPALKEAYDHYKLIEAMCNEPPTNPKEK
jgi:expansin (peptidoglycan-binding protein)